MIHVPSGIAWLHCDGPDGRVCLLARVDSRKGTVTVFEDANTEYVAEWPWVHKWRVFAITEVERPIPMTEGLAHLHPDKTTLVRAVVDENGSWGWAPAPHQSFESNPPSGPVPSGTDILDHYGVEIYRVT